MSKAQTDIRTTSYDADTANAVGYQGTIADALAQVRAERKVLPTIQARQELLKFLGADRDIRLMSGEQIDNDIVVYLRRANLFTQPEDDTVVYFGADEVSESPVSKYSVGYAQSRGWLPS